MGFSDDITANGVTYTNPGLARIERSSWAAKIPSIHAVLRNSMRSMRARLLRHAGGRPLTDGEVADILRLDAMVLTLGAVADVLDVSRRDR